MTDTTVVVDPVVAAPAVDDTTITTAPLPETASPDLSLNEPPTTKTEVDNDTPTFEYTPTGDSGLDTALAYIGGLGISGEDPAIVSAAAGDFTAIEAKLKELDPKGYALKLQLAKDSYARVKDAAAARDKPIADAVYAAVGGPENWQAILKWARENATDDERAQANKGIQAGPVAAAATAAALRDGFIRKGGTLTGKTALSTDAASAAPATSKLSMAEYTNAIAALAKAHGPAYSRTDAYKQLRARVA